MDSRWPPAARLDLIAKLANRPGPDSESFFVAYGLGPAYLGPGRGSGKQAKINAALYAAEADGHIVEILDALAMYLGVSPPEVTLPKDDVLPVPMNEGQRKLLQAIWDGLYRTTHWPTLREVDQELDRSFDLDLYNVAEEMPSDLLLPWRLDGLQPDQELQLTVAGAAACCGSDGEVEAFLDAIQLATSAEREFVPDGESDRVPSLTAGDLRTNLHLPVGEPEDFLIRVGLLLAAEHWGWISAARGEPGQASWNFGLGRRVRRLRGIKSLDDYWQATRPSLPDTSEKPTEIDVAAKLDTIFLVHGHDYARHEVARFLEQSTVGAKVEILAEQPNKGMTVIEKFEHHAGAASFAVVLLTPDDVGRAVSATADQPRARQNVVFELGYFFGKLGRDRVVVLNKGKVERPSDVAGLVYIDYPAGNWKLELAQELRSAGFTIVL